MFINEWQRWISRSARRVRSAAKAINTPVKRRLGCESLEDRTTPSANPLYVSNNFQSVGPGGLVTDPSVGASVLTATLGTNAFTTIGAALAVAGPSTTIEVFKGSGSYNEDMVITQSGLTLESYPGQTATVSAPVAVTNMIVVEAAGVAIRTLTIDGANLASIGIANTVTTNGSGGPFYDVSGLIVQGNTIKNLSDGVSITAYASGSGNSPTSMSSVEIEGNTLSNNGYYGIILNGNIGGFLFDNNISSPNYATGIVEGGASGTTDSFMDADFNTITVGVGGNGIAVVNNNNPNYSFDTSGNTITGPATGATSDGTYTSGTALDGTASLANAANYTWGIDIQNDLAGNYYFSSDNIGVGGSAAGANFAQGIHVWSTGTSSVTLDSPTIGHSYTGIAVVGVDPNFASPLPAGGIASTAVTITGADIAAFGVGIKVQNSPSNVFVYPASGPGSSQVVSPTTGTVTAVINDETSGTYIHDTPVGILVDATGTATATADLTGTSANGGDTIATATTAIQLNGANAKLAGGSLGGSYLASTPGKFVVLSGGAYVGSHVDGTGLTYVGSAPIGTVVGSAATVLQGFAIQNQITDADEGASVGYVLVTPNNLYVTPATGNIQNAINVAPSNFTINIQAGNYNTSLTLQAESLTLSGSSNPGAVRISGSITGTGASGDTLNLNDLTFNGGTLVGYPTVTFSSTSSTQGVWTDTASGGSITFSRTGDQATGSVSIAGTANIALNGSSFAGTAAKGGNYFYMAPAFTGGPAITAFGGSGSFNTLYLNMTGRNPVLLGAVPASSIPAGGNQNAIAYSGFASIPAKGTSLALDGGYLLPTINGNSAPTGFQGVTSTGSGTVFYSPATGYGWNASANEFYRGTQYGVAPSPIFVGGAYNSGGIAGARTFTIAVAGSVAVPLTLYAGDTYGTNHPETFSIYINNTSATGPATYTVNTGGAGNFQTLSSMVTPVGGVITVTLQATASSFWVLNGIQVG